MPRHSRNYAAKGEMFRCAVYDEHDELVRTYGPYDTSRAAAGQRTSEDSLRPGWRCDVESTIPVWTSVPGYERKRDRGQSE